MQIDVKHLVMSRVLAKFPTPAVEQNLSPEAHLQDDLGLSSIDIYELGLTIENELQILGLGSLSDEQITPWKTVQDICDTIAAVPGIEDHEEEL